MKHLSNIKPVRGVPTVDQINSIPLAAPGVFELSDAECRRTRAFLYSINKDGIRKFRTVREAPFLFVIRWK